MSTVEEQIATQVANIERSTGKILAEWIAIVRASGIEKHGQAVAMLKAESRAGPRQRQPHRDQARARPPPAARPCDDELVASHYAGKNAALRPAYDAVIAERVDGYGPDVELAPKKTYVSLRRRKQFASVGPAAGQLEVCVNLPGQRSHRAPEADHGHGDPSRPHPRRRRASTASFAAWLREAYERA